MWIKGSFTLKQSNKGTINLIANVQVRFTCTSPTPSRLQVSNHNTKKG